MARKPGAKAADNEFLACQFILGADSKRYKRLKTGLGNRFVFGNDDYPNDVTQALAILENYKYEGGGGNSNNNNINKDKSPRVVFEQTGHADVACDYTSDKPKDQGFICGKIVTTDTTAPMILSIFEISTWPAARKILVQSELPR